MQQPTSKDTQTLEAMIDRIGLYETVSIIEAICAAKAYYDALLGMKDAANFWLSAGAHLCEASSRIET